ncbi:MAG: hypothetical protein ACRDSZ_11920 [Pseudonocardiaceae bacterium]
MTATHGVAGRGSLAAALLAPVAAVVLMAAACATSDELTDPVVPLGTIVPLQGGSDFPDPARALLQEADRELRAGDFDAAAQAARRASAGAGPATKCVADAVQGVADVNRGNVRTGLDALQDGECAINVVPDDVRVEMATLIYRTQAVGSALIGDDSAAERYLENALQSDPDSTDVIVAQFCRAVTQPGSFKRCAPPVTSPQPTTAPVPTSASSAVPTRNTPPVPTSASSTAPTTNTPPAPTPASSTAPTTSKPPVATTTSDSPPTTPAG